MATRIYLTTKVLTQNALATPGRECGLRIGNSNLNFAECQGLQEQLGESVDYNLLWTYEAGLQEGNLLVAVDAAAPANGYIAFGIPKTPGIMQDGSAIVIKANASALAGATAQQYFLGGYSTSLVKPGGVLNLQDISAQYAAGRLQATFSLLGVSPSQGIISSIVAVGNQASNGGLREHSTASGIDLSIPAPAPAPGPLLDSAPPPASIPILPASAGGSPSPMENEDDREEATAPGQASAPSPGNAVDCSLAAGPGQAPVAYGSCTSLQGAAPDFRLLWRIAAENPDVATGGRRLQQTTANSDTNVTLAINVAKSDGWASIGVPANAGQMLGANAVLFKVCPTCPSGADAVFRYLAGKTEDGIDQPGRLNVSNITAWAQGGRLQGYFTIALPSASLASQPFIFATGPLSSQGICQFHADGEGGVTLNLQSGVILAASGGIDDHKSVAHGWIMAISWGVLIPLGAVLARNFKTVGTGWFNAHRIIQTIGWSLGWVGFGIGVDITDGDYGTHQALGIVIQILGTFQVILGFLLRPVHASAYRRLWNLSHWWMGRTAIGLGVANVYLGLIVEGDVSGGYVIAYSVVLGAITLTAFSKESYDYLSLPPPTYEIPRHPHALSTDPVTAPKPFAGLRTGHVDKAPRPDGHGRISSDPLRNEQFVVQRSSSSSTPYDASV
eukprot:jgi/Botrbrau1/4724/Bobra.0218s0038.2